MSYCKAIQNMPAGNKRDLHQRYHDYFYGFPIADDNELFGRLILEINQAGLSWETILRKEQGFRDAYDGFDINKIANYSEEDVNRLLNDAAIIRNRLKIHAAIHNAQKVLELQKEYGSFRQWIEYHHPLEKANWVKLFRRTFKFTGGEIVGEFLMSIGILPGAHDSECPIHLQLTQNKI